MTAAPTAAWDSWRRERATPRRPVGPKKRAIVALETACSERMIELAARFKSYGTPDHAPRGVHAAHIAGEYVARNYTLRKLGEALWAGERHDTYERLATLHKLLDYARTEAAREYRRPPADFFEGERPLIRVTPAEHRAHRTGERAGYAAVARLLVRLLESGQGQAG